MKQNVVIGAIASVDAGKTTLSEILLYKTSTIRKFGRVDHKDSYLDYNTLEKEKGITIFNKEARFSYKDKEFIYIDTPGHKELENERNRSLKVLDGAILVISATSNNLNNEIDLYKKILRLNLPCFIFVNKMDIAYDSEDAILNKLKNNLTQNCLKLDDLKELVKDNLIEDVYSSLLAHEIVPVIFGSALKDINIDTLLDSLDNYLKVKPYNDNLNCYLYRIDEKGFAYLKILSGTLKNKTSFGSNNKINELYEVSGNSFKNVQEAYQNDIVAVKGLKDIKVGTYLPSFHNDLNYNLEEEKIIDVIGNKFTIFNKIKVLNDLMPELDIHLIKDNIFINIEGQLKEEIVKKLLKEEFKLDVNFVCPQIEEEYIEEEIIEEKEESHYIYKRETISDQELNRVFNSIYKPKEKNLKTEDKQKEDKQIPVYKDILYMIDGYNLMHSLDEYNDEDFSILRDKVIDIVCDFKGYVNADCVLVFDAYKKEETVSRVIEHDNITIVYTKNRQTADEYIERKTKELKDDYKIIVVTSDYLEQIRVFANGASRLSSRAFIERYNNFKKDKIKNDIVPNRPMQDLRKLFEDQEKGK